MRADAAERPSPTVIEQFSKGRQGRRDASSWTETPDCVRQQHMRMLGSALFLATALAALTAVETSAILAESDGRGVRTTTRASTHQADTAVVVP
jgi:hypothetical protein